MNRRKGAQAILPLLLVGDLMKASAWHLAFWLACATAIYAVDPLMAKTVMYGAVTAILPAALMARGVFKRQKSASAQDYTRAVYKGELNKFLLTVVLFALVFAEGGQVKVGVLFGVFLLAMIIQWVIAARRLLRD